MSRQQLHRFGGTQHAGLWVARQDHGQGPRMVLLGMMGHDEIDLAHVLQSLEKSHGLARIHGVEERSLLGALDQIRVVACASLERDQRVEQPPVPVDSSHPGHPGAYLSRSHCFTLSCLASSGYHALPAIVTPGNQSRLM